MLRARGRRRGQRVQRLLPARRLRPGSLMKMDQVNTIRGFAELHIAKNRHGPTGKAHLAFNGEYTL
ncbi:MAG: hypothetical protein KAZ69_17240, partial [Candidatus Microthrix sp.]|nr:hypothetical protein [Candidatus Microthrix sp.]